MSWSLERVAPEPLAVKVPEITILFWIVKLLTTAGGEATSDFLGDHNQMVGAVVEVGVFAVALWWQFRTRRYEAGPYWLLAFAIAIFGTGVSGTLHVAVGVPYAGTTALWAVVLAGIFWQWYRSEGTLSIHSITTRRRETYYWATVFATFALGTALGDLTATSFNLGFLTSGILFSVVILVPLAAWRLGLDSVVAFWCAYVVTRPLGASFADYISKPHKLSGADFGDGRTTIVFIAAVAALVVFLVATKPDVQGSPGDVARSRPAFAYRLRRREPDFD